MLARFLEQRPNVEVTPEPVRPERILDRIMSGECELGLTADFAGHAAVDAARVEMRTVCILPPGHLAEDRAEVVPADLRPARLIQTRIDDPFYADVMAAFEQCGVKPAGRVETRQFGTACKLVAKGLGVSVAVGSTPPNSPGPGSSRGPSFPG